MRDRCSLGRVFLTISEKNVCDQHQDAQYSLTTFIPHTFICVELNMTSTLTKVYCVSFVAVEMQGQDEHNAL